MKNPRAKENLLKLLGLSKTQFSNVRKLQKVANTLSNVDDKFIYQGKNG